MNINDGSAQEQLLTVWRGARIHICHQAERRQAKPMELQQGRQLLQRFLKGGLPTVAQHCGDLTDDNGCAHELVSGMSASTLPFARKCGRCSRSRD
jgi:hypothetical protein